MEMVLTFSGENVNITLQHVVGWWVRRFSNSHYATRHQGVSNETALIITNIKTILKNNDNIENRTNMLLGSGIAGKSIYFTGCGICHCIAHTLGSMTNVPHGIAIAYGLIHTIEPKLKYNLDLLSRYKGVFENLSSNALTQKIQDWVF